MYKRAAYTLLFWPEIATKLPDLWKCTAALIQTHKRKRNNSTFELNRQASTKITRTIGFGFFSEPQKQSADETITHRSQYTIFPPNRIQRPVNTNNVFSKRPRRHESARGDETEISLQRLVRSQTKSSEGRVCIMEENSFISRLMRKQRSGPERCSTPGSELRRWGHCPRWTGRFLVFGAFLKTGGGPQLSPSKETDVRNLRRGKSWSLRHLSINRPERLPPTSGRKEPSDLPEHP